MPSKVESWKIEVKVKNRSIKVSPKELAALRKTLRQIVKGLPDVSWRVRPRPWLQVVPVKPGASKVRRKK